MRGEMEWSGGHGWLYKQTSQPNFAGERGSDHRIRAFASADSASISKSDHFTEAREDAVMLGI